MKKMILTMVTAFFALTGFTQARNNAVTWSFETKKIADKTYEVRLTANISGNYHLYAQNNIGDVSAAVVSFTKNPLLTLQGKVKEVGKLISKYEDIWKAKVNYFENTVTFVQVVKSKVAVPVTLKGNVNYMVCNDRQCLPPKDVPFELKLGK
jgi:hypothetical protein